MSFKYKLNKIEKEINNFTNNPSKLMPLFIKRKLDRSLENYLREVEININYLLYRKEEKVQKYIDKTILREERKDE